MSRRLAGPCPRPQSVHTSTHSATANHAPVLCYLGPGPGSRPELEPAPGGPRSLSSTQTQKKLHDAAKVFPCIWSLLSIASAVPASRLTSKPARAAMPCCTLSVSKAAPFLVRRKFDRTSARRRRYASTRVSTAACSALDKVSASSPHLMPPGSHRSPLSNVRVDIVLCEKCPIASKPPAPTASTRCQIPTTSREVGPSRPPYTARPS